MENLVRKNIKKLRTYTPNNHGYRYKLDANESPYQLSKNIINTCMESLRESSFNRYPDSNSQKLRNEIGKYIGVDYKNIIVGNGSNQLIGFLLNTFVDSGDTVVSHKPTFSMYSLTCQTIKANYIGIKSDENFYINTEEIINMANQKNAKIIFLCSPNNPSGNLIPRKDIIRILNETQSIVVVDEAYIEFGGKSLINNTNDFDRLVVLRTLSKAFGLAGIRIGYLVSNLKVIKYLNLINPPYNLNTLTQIVGENVLSHKEEIMERINEIKENRQKIFKELRNIRNIKVYPSEANFLLFKVKDSKRVYDDLLNKGILVRYFDKGVLDGYIRVTVGKKEENTAFIEAIKEVVEE